jgi:hypothetical protein
LDVLALKASLLKAASLERRILNSNIGESSMTPAATNTAGGPLGLPMTAIFTVKTSANRAVAHALDFDLVAVAPTSEEALLKLRSAVKHHIEFGFKYLLAGDEIRQSAPKECWDKVYNGSFTLGEDIEVNHQRIRTITRVVDEPEPCSTGA